MKSAPADSWLNFELLICEVLLVVVVVAVLAELRGMRAEQASDRFARGAAVLS